MPLRKVTIAVASLLVVAFVALVAIGWYYSNVMHDGALALDHNDEALDLTVTDVGEGTVTLQVTEETDVEYGRWRHEGTWGLIWDGGYGRVGRILEQTEDEVVRSFTPVTGTLAEGTSARIDGFAFEGDPMSARGIPFEEVQITSDLGQFPAWLTEGNDDTWAIFTHGRTADRTEALRALAPFAEVGVPSLVITYRNDKDLPVSASGFYDYGRSEWEDLEAAVRYALDNGAKEVIVVGYSMGGGITASFLLNSALAENVAGAVLDAPMLDFSDTIDYGAERRSLPGILTWAGKTVAAMRFGIDWGAVDYLSRADEFDVPVLLFHGDLDRTVHIRTSARFAELRPDIVTYVPVEGAGHVNAWNADPEAYESTIASFLDKVTE